MPQLLGRRLWYKYTDEGGRKWGILRDEDLISAFSDLEPVTSEDDVPPLVRGLSPRVTFWQDKNGNRKTVPASSEDPAYTSNKRQTITFNDTKFELIGRRGEQKTIAGNSLLSGNGGE